MGGTRDGCWLGEQPSSSLKANPAAAAATAGCRARISRWGGGLGGFFVP